MSEDTITEVLDALGSTGGVVGVVVSTSNGLPIRDTFAELDRSTACTYAAFAADLTMTAKPLFQPDRDGGPLESIRVKTSMHDIVIRTDGKYTITIVYDAGSG
jgi:predicted regulator of Ras-like GTPase activity (Roadblock/LC7/MglB family)